MESSKRLRIPQNALSIFMVIQIALFIWIILQYQDWINTDAVPYIRIAQYYASGKFDLMISGYWGPLLSWIIAVLLGFMGDPLSAAHMAMGISALVYLIGCISVFQVMDIRLPSKFVALGIIVLFSIHWSTRFITPDLLMSGVLCLAISRIMHLDWCKKTSVQFSGGLFFGTAYLAKAVALPLSCLMVGAVGLMWAICEQTKLIRIFRSVGTTFLGLILIAGPWIIILSVKYERPVFSTSAEINYSVVGPSHDNQGHPTFHEFHIPENGRITSWEDPSQLSYARWSPFESSENMDHQWKIIRENARTSLNILKNYDWLGIGLVAVIFGFLFHTPWVSNIRSDRWRWSIIFIVCLVGIYLPVAGKDVRYYMVAYPFFLGTSLGFLEYQLSKSSCKQNKSLYVIGLSIILLSFVLPQAKLPTINPNPGYQAAKVIKEKLNALNISGPVASTGYSKNIDLYTAFLMNVPYHGKSPNAQTLEEVEASLAKIIIVDHGSILDEILSKDKNFVGLDEDMFEELGRNNDIRIKVYINTKI